MEENYYQILGVNKDATYQEIKKAYLKLAKQYHPDMNKASNAEAMFKKVTTAYETLKDEELRKKYDESLSEDLYLTLLDTILSNYSKGIYANYSQAKTIYGRLVEKDIGRFYYVKAIYLKYVEKASQNEIDKVAKNLIRLKSYIRYIALLQSNVINESNSEYQNLLNILMKIEEKSVENFFAIGFCNLKLKKYEQAIRYLDSIKDSFKLTYYYLGIIYKNQYKTYDAEKCFLTDFQKRNNPRSCYELAQIYIKQSKVAQAEKYIKLLIDNTTTLHNVIPLYVDLTNLIVEYKQKLSKTLIIQVYKNLSEIIQYNDVDPFCNKLHEIALKLYNAFLYSGKELFSLSINLYRQIADIYDEDTIVDFIPKLVDDINPSSLSSNDKGLIKEAFSYIEKLIINKSDQGHVLLFKYFEKFEYESEIDLIKIYAESFVYANFLLGKYYFDHSNYYLDYLNKLKTGKNIKNDPLDYLFKAAFKNSKANDLLLEIYTYAFNYDIYNFMMNTNYKGENSDERLLYGNFLICLFNKYIKENNNKDINYKNLVNYIKRLCQINVLDYFYKLPTSFYLGLNDETKNLILQKLVEITSKISKDKFEKDIIYQTKTNNNELQYALGKNLKRCPICGGHLKGLLKNKCEIHGKINF